MKRHFLLLTLALCAITSFAKDIKTIIVTTNPQMHCEACENKIKSNMRFEKGIKAIETNISRQEVTLTYDADKTTPEKLMKGFEKIGYTATVKTGWTRSKLAARNSRQVADQNRIAATRHRRAAANNRQTVRRNRTAAKSNRQDVNKTAKIAAKPNAVRRSKTGIDLKTKNTRQGKALPCCNLNFNVTRLTSNNNLPAFYLTCIL